MKESVRGGGGGGGETKTERQRQRQTDRERQTDRDRDREIESQRKITTDLCDLRKVSGGDEGEDGVGEGGYRIP